MQTKQCHGCQETLPTSMFWKDVGSSDGLFRVCKTCGSIQNKDIYWRNRQDLLLRNRVWREEHKDHIALKKAAARLAHCKWVTYCLDFPDGCYYIGSTCAFSSRITLHRSEMRHSRHRNPRIRAAGYGPDSFSARILGEFESKGGARIAEGTLIAQHRGNPNFLNHLGLSTALFGGP